MGSDYAGEVSAASRSAKVVEPIAIAVCCLVIIVALVVGVGLAAGLVLRHVVQTLPLWIGVLAGARRSRAVGWIGLPMFLFWLVLMSLIWLYLLGIARVISGHFSPIEIAMTILVGAAGIVGIAGPVPVGRGSPMGMLPPQLHTRNCQSVVEASSFGEALP